MNDLIYEALRDVLIIRPQLDMEVDDDTTLYGSDGILGSLELVMFLTNVELAWLSKYNKKIVLADEKAMSYKNSPFKTIGHLKNFGRMGRNYLKGIIGDIVNPLISAVGLNLRRITNILKESTA